MDFIKYIDFFSIKFNFYTNNQPNYQNIFGGIMTFIYVIVCILIFFAISYDDFSRLNPIISTSEIPDSERKLVNMKNEKIWIPFRIVNYENKFVDHREILYIVPFLIEGRLDDKIGMNLTYHSLKYKLCNETAMINRPDNYRIDVPLNELFCIDRDDILFGGNWNHEFLNYIEINLYLCFEGIQYNSSDPRCSKLDNYLRNLNSSLLIDFYYPIVQFQPTNFESPIKIIYKNYYYRLTSFSYKIEKLYLKENILSDDRNMVKTNFKNSSYWGMSTLYTDDYFLPSQYDPISNNSNTSRIYALNIYMDDGTVYYTRSFRKILIIFSNAFPMFRLVLYFLKKFTQHVKMSLTKRKLTGLIFENRKMKPKKIFYKKKSEDYYLHNSKQNKKPINLTNKSEHELIKDQNSHNNKDYQYIQNNSISNTNTVLKQKNESNNSIINFNILNNKFNSSIRDSSIIKYNKMQFSFIKPRKKRSSLYESLKLKIKSTQIQNKEYYRHRKRKKYIFPYYYFFFDLFFDKLIYPKKFLCISKAYFTVYNFMSQIYDISTHIILFKQFNSLNNILKELSEENVFCPSNLFHKININDNRVIEKINKDLKSKKSIFYSNNYL